MERDLWRIRLRKAPHMSIGNRCAICNDYFKSDDWFVVCMRILQAGLYDLTMPYNSKASADLEINPVFGSGYEWLTYPRKYSGYKTLEIVRPNQEDWLILCYDKYCPICVNVNEYSAVHRDCVSLVEMKNEKSRYAYPFEFWLSTTWRQSWYDGLQLNIPRLDRFSGFGDFAVEALETLGLPSMRNMPHEIIEKIKRLCRSSLFWRYCEVEDFPLVSPRERHHKLYGHDFALKNVHDWTRGYEPSICVYNYHEHDDEHDDDEHDDGEHEDDNGDENYEKCTKPFRLTFDSWGLKKIERLSVPKANVYTPSIYDKFVVISSIQADMMRVRFEPGVARLKASKSAKWHLGSHLAPSTVWDVPNPPAYHRLLMYEPLLEGQIIRCRQFSTIPLSGCSGITFFMRFGRIVGFHCHTQRETCAQTSFERLRLPEPEKYHWHYLPISEEDEIVSLGMSSPQSDSEEEYNGIIFRLKLAGYVIIGSTSEWVWQYYYWLPIERPQAIFYDMSGPCDSIRTVAADSKGKSTWRLRRERFNFSFDVCTVYGKEPPFEYEVTTPYETRSCAPLDNAVAVNVFYWPDSNKWAGILLKYVNGGQRALGQCRLGIDRVEEYTKLILWFPAHIYERSYRISWGRLGMQSDDGILGILVGGRRRNDISARFNGF
ncbi:hypothetical protein E4U43_001520 [Claviceps pusilla]|uniref:Uncharacterized protein n=1 Tax=Claviceps pusilla TaxID=123648 RepID=A0A9P7NG44_9HYPO|nr:hypothetical protein E4U43_001520 [Claviceps pusilla]